MKNLDNKIKILIILALVIIATGIIIVATKGFNFDLRYRQSKRIELDLGKEFEISDVKKIVDEIKPNEEILIQKVEVYEDSVSITANEITEEEKTNIINKINEKYETELSEENIEIKSIPHTKLLDIIKPYIMPFIILTIIILVYMIIRYRSLKLANVILKTLLTIIVSQAILLSIIAITRVPVGKLTISMVIALYMIILVGITSKFEKDKTKIEIEETKN